MEKLKLHASPRAFGIERTENAQPARSGAQKLIVLNILCAFGNKPPPLARLGQCARPLPEKLNVMSLGPPASGIQPPANVSKSNQPLQAVMTSKR